MRYHQYAVLKESDIQTRIIHLKYIWDFFGIFYAIRSFGIMLEV